MSSEASSPEAFIERWSRAEASERANAQLFLSELCDVLDLPHPENSHTKGYSFEFPVRIPVGPTQHSDGRIDLYRRGSFVLEAKQFLTPRAEQSDPELVAVASGLLTGRRESAPSAGAMLGVMR